MPAPEVLGRNGTYMVFRKLHTRVAAYRQYLRTKAERPRRRGAARGQDRRPLAERGATGAVPRARRPPAGCRPCPQQRLRLRRRPERVQVPRRRSRPTGQPSRLARPRRQRKRPPTPHDPARHQLRPCPARGGARRRRRRPRHRVRVRRLAHRAPVRIRKNSMAERRHLYRHPQRGRPPRRPGRRARDVHHPVAANPSPASRPAPVRHNARRRVLLCPGPASTEMARRAGH